MTMDSMLLNKELRYKKYKELLKLDNRMWSLKYHGLYLLSNNFIILLLISYYFRIKYMKDLKPRYPYKHISFNKNMFKSRLLLVSGIYIIPIICLYYYSRIYLY